MRHLLLAISPFYATFSLSLFEPIEPQGHCEVINALIDLQLSDSDVVQPDLVVVLKENCIITQKRSKAFPIWSLKSLSPSNRTHDLDWKMGLYEQFPIPSSGLWILMRKMSCDFSLLRKGSLLRWRFTRARFPGRPHLERLMSI